MSELTAFSSGIRTVSALLCAGALSGLAGGCLVINKEHCGYKDGGVDNPCPDGFVCSVCAVENNGCVPIDQKDTIQQSCLDSGTTAGSTMTTSPTDGTTSVAPTTNPVTETSTDTTLTTMTTTAVTDTETATETTATDTSTSTTLPPIDCDPDVVVDNQDCIPYYCLPNGKCGTCDQLPMGSECADLDPMKPVCDAGSVCVQCTPADTKACPAQAPACDPESGQCTQCTEHSECPDTACDLETGMCFPKEHVYYVKNSNGCVPGDGKTPDAPFCTLGQVPLVEAQPTTIKIIGGGTAPGFLSIPDKMIVAVTRHGPQIPELNGTTNAEPTIGITGPDSRVYLWLLRFRYAQVNAILKCENGGALYVHDTGIEGNGMNAARAIDANKCDVRLRRSWVLQCGHGIIVNDSDLVVESSYLVDNGKNDNSSTFGAFNFVNTATAKIVYSTVVAGKNTSTTSAFTCTGVGSKQVSVRNSAVLGLAPLQSMGCVTQDLGVVQESPDLVAHMNFLTQWFTPKGNLYAPKDSAMNPADPLENQAMWAAGDPLLDFDGAPIPQDESSFAGADQPPP